MTTKKEMQKASVEVRAIFNYYLGAMEDKKYKGKAETNSLTDDGKIIIISFNKFQMNFYLTREEYLQFKELEAEHWGKDGNP